MRPQPFLPRTGLHEEIAVEGVAGVAGHLVPQRCPGCLFIADNRHPDGSPAMSISEMSRPAFSGPRFICSNACGMKLAAVQFISTPSANSPANSTSGGQGRAM